MKIMIGYPTGEFGRRVDFYDFLNQLIVPCDQLRMSPHGQSPAKARNLIFEQALLHNCTHVFLIDDDMALKPDTLVKLLEHDKDVVSGLYVARAFPHNPIAFSAFNELGHALLLNLNKDIKGLVKVAATGFGCCLIKTDVLKKMSRPWVKLGSINPEEWCDDIGFFWQLQKEAPEVEVYLDTEVRPGHIGSMILWAHQDENYNWMTGYDASGNSMIYVPRPETMLPDGSGIEMALQIEGWMFQEELLWLAETAKKSNLIVEFGSHCGRSTRALADASPEMTRVIAVDPWSGEYLDKDDKQTSFLGGSRFDDFQKNMRDHILSGKVLPVRKLSTDFKLDNEKADFVFIDGDHRYEVVKQDIENGLSMLAPGGILSGHDYHHEAWPGVAQAVDEKFGRENINLVNTIWWVKV